MSGSRGEEAIRAVVLDYLRSLSLGSTDLRLERNRPNPFGGTTTWELFAPAPVRATLAVYDAGGKLVWKTALPSAPAGVSEIAWNGLTLRGRRAPAGTYYYRFTAGAYHAGGRVTLLR